MENNNLISMIGHFSQSAFSVQHLVAGLGYVLGLLFFWIALQKFHSIGSKKSGTSSESLFVPIAYILGGSGLLFLPTVYVTLANTVFGSGNVLEYTKYNPYNIFNAMTVLIRTAGLIWFVRGCVLLTQASEPGVQHGPKGLLLIVAGIFAMNFETTLSFVNWLLNQVIAYTLKTNPPAS